MFGTGSVMMSFSLNDISTRNDVQKKEKKAQYIAGLKMVQDAYVHASNASRRL